MSLAGTPSHELEAYVIRVALLLELMVMMLGCTRPKPPQEEPKEVTSSNLVSRVVSTLADSRRSGSLVYEGACTPLERITDSFRVSTPTSGAPAVHALHDAFANEPKLTVGEDASSRIRVVGGNVHTDLLDLRISQISFHSEDNPRDATGTLLTLPEVKAYMQSHHIHFMNAMGGLAPMPKGVHLNATLKNATISGTLDRIAQSFPGVWIYGECATASGERLVDFTFIEF
jgi:hypothetical protein